MAQGPSPIDQLIEATQADLDRTQQELRDINRMMTQSKVEVDKLAQRNAQVTAHLRQMQGNLENTPRTEIKSAYDAAQDSLQRLFTMRGQLEKLQSDQSNLGRLVEHLQRSLEALQASGVANAGKSAGPGDDKPMIVRIVEAQEAERQRLSRQIHDGPAQALSNFILQTEIAMRLFAVDPERAKAELTSLKMAATGTFQKVRDFIFDLRPMMLDDLGLVPTVKRYVDSFKEKSQVQATLSVTGVERRLESVREVMIFRGIQELLTNIRNHAQASQVRITMDVDDVRVRTVVEDNGKGFDVGPVLGGQTKTIGLPTLKERMDLLGGQLDVESQPGQGTRVMMEVPIGEPVGK